MKIANRDIKIALLAEELENEFPEHFPKSTRPTEGQPATMSITHDAEYVYIKAEGLDETRVQKVVDKHDPLAQTKKEKKRETDAQTRASATAKLKALGLTDEEIEVLTRR